MWLGKKQMERLTKARLYPASKPLHIKYIFTINTPILYMYFTSSENLKAILNLQINSTVVCLKLI